MAMGLFINEIDWIVPQRQPELCCHTGCPSFFGTYFAFSSWYTFWV
jgi:hypothetical protein